MKDTYVSQKDFLMRYKFFQERRRMGIGLAILLLLCFFISQSSHAKIVFSSNREGDNAYHIYVMEDNGSNVRRISNPDFYDVKPNWFPDGTRIVFERDLSRGKGTVFNAEFLILDVKSQKERRFMDNHPTDRFPNVSPDGKQIAFTSKRAGEWDIYVMNLESGVVKELTDNLGKGFSDRMDWSPDGRKIAYHHLGKDGENIWIMNAGGRQKKRLSPLNKGENIIWRYAPRWSLSGKYIMYTEFEHRRAKAGEAPKERRVATRLIIQDVVTRRVNVHNFPKTYAIVNGCWIRDDRTVLLNIHKSEAGAEANFDIYRYNLISRQLTNLTKHPADDMQPGWVSGSLTVFPLDKLAVLWAHLKQID